MLEEEEEQEEEEKVSLVLFTEAICQQVRECYELLETS